MNFRIYAFLHFLCFVFSLKSMDNQTEIKLFRYFTNDSQEPWKTMVLTKENQAKLAFGIAQTLTKPTICENGQCFFYSTLVNKQANEGVMISEKILQFSAISDGTKDVEAMSKNIHIPLPLPDLTIQKGCSVLVFLLANDNLLKFREDFHPNCQQEELQASIIRSLSRHFAPDYLIAAENLANYLVINIKEIDISTCCRCAIPTRISFIITNLALIGANLLFGQQKKPVDPTTEKYFKDICNEYQQIAQGPSFREKYFILKDESLYYIPFLCEIPRVKNLFKYIFEKAKQDKILVDDVIQTLKTSIDEKINILKNRTFIEVKPQSNQNFTVELHGKGLISGGYRTGFYSVSYLLKSSPHSLPLFTTVNVANRSSLKNNSIPIIVQELQNGHLVLFDCRDIVEDEGIPTEDPKLCKPLAVIHKNVSKKERLACIGKIFSLTDAHNITITFEVIECADEKSKYSKFNFYSADPSLIGNNVKKILCGGFYPKEMESRTKKQSNEQITNEKKNYFLSRLLKNNSKTIAISLFLFGITCIIYLFNCNFLFLVMVITLICLNKDFGHKS